MTNSNAQHRDQAAQRWLLTGYKVFAQQGPGGLKVETLARKVNVSKSSFYHHFGDMTLFTDALLQYHLKRASEIAIQERACKTLDPDLLHVLVACKVDLLFNRQLRVNRHVPVYRQCFEKATEKTADAIARIWADGIGLRHDVAAAELILALTLENFFLQITAETLHYEWLSEYIGSVRRTIGRFIASLTTAGVYRTPGN